VGLFIGPMLLAVTWTLCVVWVKGEATGTALAAPEPPATPRLEAAMRAAAAGRPVLVAGSTMAGEESAVIAAFRAIGGGERALLVLAPRHPERWDEVARLLAASALPWQRRSAIEATSERPAVVLLDSLGELAALYRLAAGCFVGGTLAPKGGHNPLEPARFARAIAVGPSMENFRDMAAQFDAARAWRRVAGSDDLATAWREWIESPATARELGERALQVVDTNRGALERTLAVLAPVLARVEAARSDASDTARASASSPAPRIAAVSRESTAASRPAPAVEMRAPGRARR
jgi:3-deoxy-D-manno-octulosonic-acid transferase